MKVACLSLLIQENSSSRIKRLIGKKYFMYFEILRLNVFKYKIHLFLSSKVLN